ncbi:MAG: LTA synthase family protein [Lentimicrobiaceae bacterium]|nr:LTA synthase family protein [Lentimicrobiaceae bacterium]
MFIVLFSPIVRFHILYTVIFVYTTVVLVVISLLGLLDIGLYADWGTRLSTQIIPALEHPEGMLACVTNLQLVVLLLIEIGIVIGFVFLYSFFFKKHKKQDKLEWWNVFVLLIYGALLIIPMRGGVQLTPLNFSRVFFSSKLYANHVAVNPYWAFSKRLIHNESEVKKIAFMEQHQCDSIIQNAISEPQKTIPIFIKPNSKKPVNVILIVLESFSNKVIEPLGGAPEVAPHFNKLAQEGILFSNFYATGNRSDKGIAALLAAYPALVGSYSILYFPEKIKHLDYLSQYFTKNDYKTHFYYAGEVDFYNTKSLILQSNYDDIVSVHNFPASERQQKWGVPDAPFYKKVLEDMSHFSTPFFLVTYNISSHPPYDIPELKERTYENAISYSDKCLGGFIAQLKTTTLWDNTLIIITSDHGTRAFKNSSISDMITYQIPMLWTGGVIDTAFINENIGMQSDLTATLVQQLGWKSAPHPFSKNLFGNHSYALYFNTDGYGFVSPELAYHYDIEINKMEFFYSKNELKKDSLLRFSKAFVQFLHADFRKR